MGNWGNCLLRYGSPLPRPCSARPALLVRVLTSMSAPKFYVGLVDNMAKEKQEVGCGVSEVVSGEVMSEVVEDEKQGNSVNRMVLPGRSHGSVGSIPWSKND